MRLDANSIAKRETVEPVANLGYGWGVTVGDGKGPFHRPRSLDEETHRFVLGQLLKRFLS